MTPVAPYVVVGRASWRSRRAVGLARPRGTRVRVSGRGGSVDLTSTHQIPSSEVVVDLPASDYEAVTGEPARAGRTALVTVEYLDDYPDEA